MLQRDCMVSMPAIRASQPSSPRALVHSHQVALVRARDAAAELELSCGPSTTQLEAAEDQARWAPAMQRGRRCKRRGRSRRPHHRPRCAGQHLAGRTRSADTPPRPSVDIYASRPGRPKYAAASHLQQNPRKWRSALHQVDHTQLDGFWSQMRCRGVVLLASRISVPSPATPCTLFTPNGAPCGLISRICFLSFAGANAGACLRMVTRSHLSTLHLGFAH